MAKRLSSLFSPTRVESSPDHHSPTSPARTAHHQLDTNVPTTTMKSSPHRLQRNHAPSPTGDGRHHEHTVSPLAPPPMFGEFGRARSNVRDDGSSRPSSRDSSRSRPITPVFPTPNSRPESPATHGKLKRRSNLPDESDGAQRRGWIAGLSDYIPYELDALFSGQRVVELWNENGDTEISIFPSTYNYPPSFKVDSNLFADSQIFQDLLRNASTHMTDYDPSDLETPFNRISLQPSGTRETTNFSMPASYHIPSIKHIHLYLEFQNSYPQPNGELHTDDQELLVLYRNFFSFLFGGALIATPRQRHLYPIFLGISSILKKFRFSNADGSTWGATPTASFEGYIDELNLADLRGSREKAVQALVLGERLKSWPLYVEGFTHIVARLEDVKSINVPSFTQISGVTLNRLERAHIDLEQRLLVVRSKLQDFDFTAMFSGIANSATAVEAKQVRFKAWKASFLDMRKRTMNYYQRKYGAWPPNAKSKKNNFEVSGLNRLVLRELYQDFCDLYNVLVDRTSLTPRMTEITTAAEETTRDVHEFVQHALRRVENEYDTATPPVMPPIPYDTPLLPGLDRSFSSEDPKSGPNVSRKVKENEVNEILLRSCNRDLLKGSLWIQDFLSYERQMAAGKTVDEIIDLRCGQWLFVYAVIQALPMTVVDCKDLKSTDGVEYFLCMPPRGGRPWMRDEVTNSKTWYSVAGGTGVMSQPSDLIDHSAEGVYRSSHCWKIAEVWSTQDLTSPTSLYTSNSRTAPAPAFRRPSPPHLSPHPSPLFRPLSNQDLNEHFGIDGSRRGSIQGGLDGGISTSGETYSQGSQSRPTSLHVYNPNITFDSILGGVDPKASKKNKKK